MSRNGSGTVAVFKASRRACPGKAEAVYHPIEIPGPGGTSDALEAAPNHFTRVLASLLVVERAEKNEFRDPIHVFIRLTDDEREVLDSSPVQRLRYVYQLGLTYLVYPGTTHKRFEHVLGVMEVASQIYDVVTNLSRIGDLSGDDRDVVEEIVPQDTLKREKWRRTLRMAALLHDLGHLPFSHAAEDALLPDDWDHERLTKRIILESEISEQLEGADVRPKEVAKLAVGPEKFDEAFSEWERLLSEIITSDVFGADRIDYLLRDSHHAGVAYGKFDHHRLIDTLRILPDPEEGSAPKLGVDEGGLHSAEALLLARYYMFTQLYFHDTRRIYDIHLKDFLSEWLDEGVFKTSVEEHLDLTDVEILSAIREAAEDDEADGHDPARRIIERYHYKRIYKRNPDDRAITEDAAQAVYEALSEEFGSQNVRFDKYFGKDIAIDFPVFSKEGRIESALAQSETLENIPPLAVEYVYISPDLRDDAQDWLDTNLQDILKRKEEE